MDRTEEYFIKMVELYSTIKADLRHICTKTDLVYHSENCDVKKDRRLLITVGAMLSGAGLVVGLVINNFFL